MVRQNVNMKDRRDRDQTSLHVQYNMSSKTMYLQTTGTICSPAKNTALIQESQISPQMLSLGLQSSSSNYLQLLEFNAY